MYKQPTARQIISEAKKAGYIIEKAGCRLTPDSTARFGGLEL